MSEDPVLTKVTLVTVVPLLIVLHYVKNLYYSNLISFNFHSVHTVVNFFYSQQFKFVLSDRVPTGSLNPWKFVNLGGNSRPREVFENIHA